MYAHKYMCIFLHLFPSIKWCSVSASLSYVQHSLDIKLYFSPSFFDISPSCPMI